MGFDPSVLLDKSTNFTVKGKRASLSVEFFEVGGGVANINGKTGYVPWPLQVAGLGLSAVPVSGAFSSDKWTLKTKNITLAEAFLTFQAGCVYAGVYGSVPFKYNNNYRILKTGVKSLPSSSTRTKVLSALEKAKNHNAFELSASWALCGGSLAWHKFNYSTTTSFSSPQAAIGVTAIRFVGTQMLEQVLRAGKTVHSVATNKKVRKAADSAARVAIPGYGLYRWLTD